MPTLPTRASPMLAADGLMACLAPNLLTVIKNIKVTGRPEMHVRAGKLGRGVERVGEIGELCGLT
eukprot:6442404-Karenia_brevis.AAC.1